MALAVVFNTALETTGMSRATLWKGGMLGPSNVSRIPAGTKKRGERQELVQMIAHGTFLHAFFSGQVAVDDGRAQNRWSTCRQWEETSSPEDWTGVNTSIQRHRVHTRACAQGRKSLCMFPTGTQILLLWGCQIQSPAIWPECRYCQRCCSAEGNW